MAKLKDVQYSKRRVIDGLRVLVNPPFECLGLMRVEFSVRIKYPEGNDDFNVSGYWYWQAFNEEKRRIYDKRKNR